MSVSDRVWSFQPNPSTIASTMSKSVLTSLEWANKADRLVLAALLLCIVSASSLSSVLFTLHKLGVTVHRCLQGKAPKYLVNCCHPTSDVASRQRLRSSSRHHLVVPRHRCSTLGRRAFSVASPMAWNALPDDLRDSSLSADNFRKTLKTHLFRNALGHLAH